MLYESENYNIDFTQTPMEISMDHHPLSSSSNIPSLADSSELLKNQNHLILNRQATAAISKIQEYPGKFNECVIVKLKRDLHTRSEIHQ